MNTPVTDVILNVIEHNNKTIIDINKILGMSGYYDYIEKEIDELDIIYNKHVEATKERIFNSVISEWFPHISLGRQNGHSTAVSLFINNNPDIKIGIVTPAQTIFNDLYHMCSINKRPKNMFRIIPDDENFHLRGITLDYVIIDVYQSHKISQKTFQNILIQSKKEIRILGVGN